jgi:hypothetical protein
MKKSIVVILENKEAFNLNMSCWKATEETGEKVSPPDALAVLREVMHCPCGCGAVIN